MSHKRIVVVLAGICVAAGSIGLLGGTALSPAIGQEKKPSAQSTGFAGLQELPGMS